MTPLLRALQGVSLPPRVRWITGSLIETSDDGAAHGALTIDPMGPFEQRDCVEVTIFTPDEAEVAVQMAAAELLERLTNARAS